MNSPQDTLDQDKQPKNDPKLGSSNPPTQKLDKSAQNKTNDGGSDE